MLRIPLNDHTERRLLARGMFLDRERLITFRHCGDHPYELYAAAVSPHQSARLLKTFRTLREALRWAEDQTPKEARHDPA